MKLTEVKTLKEEINKKQLKEMFPTATDAQIDYALTEAPNFSGAVDTLKNLTTKAGKAALKTGKKVVDKSAPVVKNLANKTTKVAKKVGSKVKDVGTQVGKDIGQGYKNLKGLGRQAVDTAKAGMDQMQKDIGGEPAVDDKKTTTAVRRLAPQIGGNMSAAITSQALQRLAAGEVLKPNERKAVAPLATAINQALQKGSNVQRIISLLKA